jgi:hypothetical protein
MLAATGLIVQDLFTFPFFGKWYTVEKVWDCGTVGRDTCMYAQGEWRQGSSVGFVIDRALSHTQTPCPSDENRQTPLE